MDKKEQYIDIIKKREGVYYAMRTYEIVLRRKNGTKIHITANAVSINKNRIGFHFKDRPSLWAKLDDVQLERMEYNEKD